MKHNKWKKQGWVVEYPLTEWQDKIGWLWWGKCYTGTEEVGFRHGTKTKVLILYNGKIEYCPCCERVLSRERMCSTTQHNTTHTETMFKTRLKQKNTETMFKTFMKLIFLSLPSHPVMGCSKLLGFVDGESYCNGHVKELVLGLLQESLDCAGSKITNLRSLRGQGQSRRVLYDCGSCEAECNQVNAPFW